MQVSGTYACMRTLSVRSRWSDSTLNILDVWSSKQHLYCVLYMWSILKIMRAQHHTGWQVSMPKCAGRVKVKLGEAGAHHALPNNVFGFHNPSTARIWWRQDMVSSADDISLFLTSTIPLHKSQILLFTPFCICFPAYFERIWRWPGNH